MWCAYCIEGHLWNELPMVKGERAKTLKFNLKLTSRKLKFFYCGIYGEWDDHEINDCPSLLFKLRDNE